MMSTLPDNDVPVNSVTGGAGRSGDGPREYTRRQMLVLSGAALASLALAGCGGGGGLVRSGGGGGGGTGSGAEQFLLDPQPAALTTDHGAAVGYLGTLHCANGAYLAFWGVADSKGVVTRITQTLYWETDPLKGIRTQYDGNGLPVRVEQEENGVFGLLIWDSASLIFKLYQNDGTFVGGAQVTQSGGAYHAAALPGATSAVGYYSGNLIGLTQGIVTFTVGGVAAAAKKTAPAANHAAHAAKTPTAQEAAQAKAIVDALAGTVFTPVPAFASALLSTIVDAYISSGQSAIGTHIMSTATHGSGVSPILIKNGLPLIAGAGGATLIGEASKRFQQTIAKDPNAATDGTIQVAYTSPSPADYRSSVTYATVRPATDPTGLRGIVASRELGTLAVNGFVDSAGKVLLRGTADNGAVIELRGTIAADSVSDGTWTVDNLPTAAVRQGTAVAHGQGSGNWNANKTPLGQCSEQQNSGGQGFFSNTYDLGKCGTFAFFYDAYTIPDHFQIYQDDNIIFDTGGEVSGSATVNVTATGDTTLIRVLVIANESGTAWTYTVGCPQ